MMQNVTISIQPNIKILTLYHSEYKKNYVNRQTYNLYPLYGNALQWPCGMTCGTLRHDLWYTLQGLCTVTATTQAACNNPLDTNAKQKRVSRYKKRRNYNKEGTQ